MPIDYLMLGQKVAYYRTQASLSQDELADMLNVERSYISKIEKGRAKPSPDILVEIAKVMNISVDSLLTDNVRSSTVQDTLQKLIENCSPVAEEIITRNAENLKQILNDMDI